MAGQGPPYFLSGFRLEFILGPDPGTGMSGEPGFRTIRRQTKQAPGLSSPAAPLWCVGETKEETPWTSNA